MKKIENCCCREMADSKPGTSHDRKQKCYPRLPIVFENCRSKPEGTSTGQKCHKCEHQKE